jgi:hypothetical protein
MVFGNGGDGHDGLDRSDILSNAKAERMIMTRPRRLPTFSPEQGMSPWASLQPRGQA